MDYSDIICDISDFIDPWNSESMDDFIFIAVFVVTLLIMISVFTIIKIVPKGKQEITLSFCTMLLTGFGMAFLVIWYLGIPVLYGMWSYTLFRLKKDDNFKFSKKEQMLIYSALFFPYIIMFISALFGVPYRII